MRRSERKQKRMNLISGLVIVGLMVFGAFGVALSYNFGGSETTLKYNDVTFRSTAQGYKAKINGKTSYFSNFPGSLELIEVPPEAKSRIKTTRMIYLTSDPDSSVFQEIGLSQYQFQQELQTHTTTYAVIALNKNSSYQLPIIACNDSTPSVPVLEFREGNETQIVMENDCIILEAPSQYGFITLKDRLLFTILGVME